MIQANELRIGNWIYIDNGETPMYPYQITAHDIEEIEGNGTDCFPIPLTPEILEACGFRNTDGWEYIESPAIKLFKNFYRDASGHYDGFLLKGCRPAIKYVHQLQNLIFAIYGEELPVNLQLKKA